MNGMSYVRVSIPKKVSKKYRENKINDFDNSNYRIIYCLYSIVFV